MPPTLETVQFIRQHGDWQALFGTPPYSITIKTDAIPHCSSVYVKLNYSQFDSDFNDPIVRECRGLTLRIDQYPDAIRPVCVPFFKFGNFGEGYCPNIDWPSARVQEKIDGSLILLWNDHDRWQISTSGTIDAQRAPLFGLDSLSFRDLFEMAVNQRDIPFAELDKDCTYMFELVAPQNKVVVSYPEPKLYHIGARNNITLEEFDVDLGIDKPKQYSFGSIEECVEATKKLPYNEEGYVVVDRYWNRVKIKSPAYVAVHYLKNNGVQTTERLLDVMRQGEVEEFLTYFPEFQENIDKIRGAFHLIHARLCRFLYVDLGQRGPEKRSFESQKEYALLVKDHPFSAYFFEYRKSGVTPRKWLTKQPTSKLTRWIDEQIAAEPNSLPATTTDEDDRDDSDTLWI